MTREEALKALAKLRGEIDSIDVELLELLNQRARVVEQIGEVKEAAGLPIYEAKRENDVFQNVTDHNRGPLGEEAATRIFERIIEEMRSLQKMRRQANGRTD